MSQAHCAGATQTEWRSSSGQHEAARGSFLKPHRTGRFVAAPQAHALFFGSHLAAEPGVCVVSTQVRLVCGLEQSVQPLQRYEIQSDLHMLASKAERSAAQYIQQGLLSGRMSPAVRMKRCSLGQQPSPGGALPGGGALDSTPARTTRQNRSVEGCNTAHSLKNGRITSDTSVLGVPTQLPNGKAVPTSLLKAVSSSSAIVSRSGTQSWPFSTYHVPRMTRCCACTPSAQTIWSPSCAQPIVVEYAVPGLCAARAVQHQGMAHHDVHMLPVWIAHLRPVAGRHEAQQ
jgi:hypothetical protein